MSSAGGPVPGDSEPDTIQVWWGILLLVATGFIAAARHALILTRHDGASTITLPYGAGSIVVFEMDATPDDVFLQKI